MGRPDHWVRNIAQWVFPALDLSLLDYSGDQISSQSKLTQSGKSAGHLKGRTPSGQTKTGKQNTPTCEHTKKTNKQTNKQTNKKTKHKQNGDTKQKNRNRTRKTHTHTHTTENE
jgi:hypothetical protein